MDAIRIVHANRLVSYGPCVVQHLLPEPGHARVQFDIDAGVERRLLAAGLGRQWWPGTFKRLDLES